MLIVFVLYNTANLKFKKMMIDFSLKIIKGGKSMKKIKRILSVVVVMCIVCSCFVVPITANAVNGNDIVSYARQFIGYPYVWGTQGPNSFDCSGFVQYVFKHFGISLPASSSSYWNNPTAYGTVIAYGSVDSAKPGDVISWSGHVAIYTENGYCVEALSPSYGVTEKIKVNSHTNGLNYKVIRIYGLESTPNPTPSPSITYTSIPEGEYKLQNANGKYLGVDAGGNKNGNVHAVNGDGSAEQKFRIKNTEIGNQYYIKNLANASQYCVNAYTPSNTLTKQSDVILWDENKSNSKYWGFEDAGGGYYYIRCMMNPQFVLTADGYNYPENVTVLPFDGRDTQKWKLEKIEETPIQKEYTITYKWEGGRGGPSTQKKPQGVDIQIFDDYYPNRFGYSFVGWSTSATAENAEYIPGSTFSKDADTTLYAVWDAATELSETLGRRTGNDLEFPYAGKCRYYKITPKYDGLYRFESTGSLDTQIFIMSPKGAVYAKDDNSGSDNNFLLDYSLNAGTTYYIKIVSKDAGKINYAFTMLFKVSYNANGGSDAPDTQYKLYKTDMKISTDIPTRNGYTFLGWSTDSSAEEVDAKPGATYKGDRDLILYAVWEKNAHKHNWIWVTDKEATCIENGIRHQECECGATQNEEHYGVFHSFGEWIVVDREEEYPFTVTQQRTCSLCGETETQNIVATPTPIEPPDNINDSENTLDYDKNGYVTTDDAVYVLKHIMMPDIFEVTGGVDFDKNGHETTDDAVYLLKHIMMPDIYPIN